MIYMLRHTQPAIEAGVCYGVSDIELDPASCEDQIARCVDRLSEVEFSKIYSSPLRRTLQLAEAIAAGKEITLDPRLKEMDFGDWEMTSWQEIFESQEGKAWFADYINCNTPKGESFKEMIQRASCVIEDITHERGDILVVTHAGFIRAAMVAAKLVECDNAFETTIEYGEIVKFDI